MATQDLRRDEVLDLLSSRYLTNQIYTELGSLVVSVNPFKLLPIYSSGVVHSYASPNSLPTHIFGFAERVYMSMVSEKSNQAILISGDTGSGKTEALKLSLQYLTQSKSGGLLQARNSIDLSSADASFSSSHEHHNIDNILQAMVLLQFFSHAQTSSHSNASRSWSWIDLLFDHRHSNCGAKVNALFLETSRVTIYTSKSSDRGHSKQRNFHIFYLLCEHRAHPRLVGLGLLPASHFVYLNPELSTTTAAVEADSIQLESDGFGTQHQPNDYESVDALEMSLKAFRSLGFEEDELNVILRLIAGVLHLGNVKFIVDSSGGVSIVSNVHLDLAAKMLQVSPKNLRAALLKPTLEEAVFSRDKLAQDVYFGLFNELITTINRGLIEAKEEEDPDSPESHKEFLTLSLLDVFQAEKEFGKEKSETLESLLAQSGNTQLSLYFFEHVFMNEQKVYEQDDIKVSHLIFPSYQPMQDKLKQLESEITQLSSKGSDGSKENASFREVHPLLKEILTNSLDGHTAEQIALLWKGKEQPREELQHIFTQLRHTHPHFLRCICPNKELKQDCFDKPFVTEQLEKGNIFHAVRLQAEGYPFRCGKPQFVHQFHYCLSPTKRQEFLVKNKASANPTKDLIDILETVAKEKNVKSFSKDEIQIGKKNVFWTKTQQEALEVLLGPEQLRARTRLQSFFRGVHVRKGNEFRKQIYNKARNLIFQIKNYSVSDSSLINELLTLAATNDVRLPILDHLRQWRVWLVHYLQLINDLKQVNNNPDSLPAVEGVLSRIELEGFFSPTSLTKSSSATGIPSVSALNLSPSGSTSPSTLQFLLRLSPNTPNFTDLRSKDFQEFVLNSPVIRELVDQLVAQRARLSARSNAIVGLKDALLSDNSEAIAQALKLAESAKLESPLIEEARALLSRLAEEQRMVAELSKAMGGSDMQALEKALDNTKRIALDAERSALIHTAINTLHRLYSEHMQNASFANDDERRDFLSRAQNYGFITEAVVHTTAPKLAERKPPPPPAASTRSGMGLFAMLEIDTEPPVVEPRTHNRGNSLVTFEEDHGNTGKKQHVRVASDGVRHDAFSTNSFELSNSPFMLAQRTELDQAISNRDLEALHKLMGAMSKSDFGHDRSRQVRRAEALAKHLEHERKIEAALEAAIEDLDQDTLRGLLKEAALCGMPVSETMRNARNVCYEIPAQELLELKVENALNQVKEDLSNVQVVKEKIVVLVKQMEELDMKNELWARKARLFLRAGTPRAHVSFKLNISDKTMLVTDLKARRSFSLLPDPIQIADVMNLPRVHHPLSKFSNLREPHSFTRLSMFKKPKNVLESMCRYQKKQLSSSLTQISKDKIKLCKEIFQNLLGYMKITYHPYPVTLGHAVIMAGVNHPELRDEIYAQLIKQTTYKIPKLGPGAKRKPIVKPGMVNCWVLLYFVINSFLPLSEEMKPVILDHIVASTHLPQGGEFDQVIQYSMHCFAAYNVMLQKSINDSTSFSSASCSSSACSPSSPSASSSSNSRCIPASIDELRLASDGELEFTQVEMSVLELVDKDRTDLEKPVRNKVKAAKIRQYNKEYFTDSAPTQFENDEKTCESPNMSARAIRARRNTGGSTLLSPGAAAAAIAQGEGDSATSLTPRAGTPQRNSLLLPSTVPRIAYPVSPGSPNQRQSMGTNPPSVSLPPISSPNQRYSSGNPPLSPTSLPRVASDVGEMPL